jgi:hypothetical protein
MNKRRRLNTAAAIFTMAKVRDTVSRAYARHAEYRKVEV